MFRTLETWCVFLAVGSVLGWGLPAQTAKPALSFYPNGGQAHPDILWQARGRGFSIDFRRDSFTLQMFLADGNRLTEQTISLPGAAGEIEPLDALPGKLNFLRGSDSSRWVRGLATYSRLRYKEVYPGIDLLFYGNQGKLEYDFVVAPGADPGRIRLRVNGMASVNGHGELQLGQGAEATLHRPMLYQNITGGKKTIAGRFARQADGSLVFECEDYDRAKTLVIDPTVNLLYATYLGGLHDDEAYTMALDPQNNSYILGESASTDYPISANAYQNQRTNVGTYTYNMALTKINPAGVLLYSTFIGDGADLPFRTPVLAADAQGNAWIGGVTISSTYPVTANAYQPVFPLPVNPGYDYPSPFLSEISSDGSTLSYSTFFAGPTGQDYNVLGIAVNKSGNVYLAGVADSGLPTTPGAYLATIPSGNLGNFVAVFNPALTGSAQLLASSYFATTTYQYITLTGMALDAAGNPWITFQTNDEILPTTANAIQPNANFSYSLYCGEGIERGLSDGGYVAKLSADLTTLLYGSYLSGGQGGYIGSNPASNDAGCDESIVAAASDANGDLYIVGYTGSDMFPTTPGAYQTYAQDFTLGVGPVLRYVAALSSDGSQLLFSTFLGGTNSNTGADFIGVDGQQNAWIASNATVPITPGALQSSLITNQTDGSLAEISSDGTTLLYGTYLPQVQSPSPCIAIYGYNGDTTPCGAAITGFAVDPQSNAYIAGTTGGAIVPVTANAFQSQFANGDANNDGNDIFFMTLGGGAIGAISSTVGGNSGDATITINGSGFQAGASCSLAQNGNTINAQAVNVSSNGTSVTCTFALSGASAGNYDVVVNNANGATITDPGAFTVQSGGQPQVWADIVGRSLIRSGVPSTYYLEYGNSGTTSAYFTTVWLAIPSYFQYTLPAGVTDVLDSSLTISDQSTSITDQTDNSIKIPFLIPVIPPGSATTVAVQLTDPTNNDSYSLSAFAQPPWFSSSADATAGLAALNSATTLAPASCVVPAGEPYLLNCLGYWAGATSGAFVSAMTQMVAAHSPDSQGNTYSVSASQVQLGYQQTFALSLIDALSLQLLGTTVPVTPQPAIASIGRQASSGTPRLSAGQIGTFIEGELYILEQTPGGIITAKTATIPEAVPETPPATAGPGAGSGPGSGLNSGGLGIATAEPLLLAVLASVVTAETARYVGQLMNFLYRNDLCSALNRGASTGPPIVTVTPCFANEQIIEVELQCSEGPIFFDQEESPCMPPNPCKNGTGSNCSKGKSGGSEDPNGKSGPLGDGSVSQYVAGSNPLSYVIYFENQATASLPAAQVVVTDQLNPALVNAGTVSLGPIAFGSNVISVPANANTFSTLYPVNSSLSVRIQGSLNPATGVLRWTFTSIDPSTGLPPSDPTVGFLPPDVDGVEGQGSVTFTVMPKSGQTTGTQIANQATVVFDANAPISTPVWLNTLDVNPPVSSVQALPQTEAQSTFTVAWSGTDVGSGIASYTIYVSENGGPFTIFQNPTATTSASFTGQAGNTYAFYSIATDGAGNVQAAKTAADTSTTIVGGTGPGGACDVGNYGAVNVSDVQTEINQAIGVTPPVNDLNGDKAVDVVDVQIVMNAALQLGCTH